MDFEDFPSVQAFLHQRFRYDSDSKVLRDLRGDGGGAVEFHEGIDFAGMGRDYRVRVFPKLHRGGQIDEGIGGEFL